VALLSKYAKSEVPVIFYVAPHDLKKTASDIKEIFGDRKVYVVREITKLHECVTETTLANFEAEERGEIVMIVEGAPESNDFEDMTIKEHLLHYINDGMDKKEAVKKVSAERGVPKNDVYQVALEI
jgi:16S rRNA (cytidine1402-2'-O)-methyltransferase